MECEITTLIAITFKNLLLESKDQKEIFNNHQRTKEYVFIYIKYLTTKLWWYWKERKNNPAKMWCDMIYTYWRKQRVTKFAATNKIKQFEYIFAHGTYSLVYTLSGR